MLLNSALSVSILTTRKSKADYLQKLLQEAFLLSSHCFKQLY